MRNPRDLAVGLRGVYERQARQWDAARPRAVSERRWLDRALAPAAPGECLLDLGCGAGEPVASDVVVPAAACWAWTSPRR